MIEISNETLILLSEVPRHIPSKRSGKAVSISAVYRWAGRGCRGVVLETLQAGGVKVTSLEALQRFFVRLTRGEVAASPPAAVPTRSRRSLESTEQELAAAGF